MTATPSTVLSTGSPEARCNLCTATFARASAEVLVKDGHTIVRCPTCGLLFRATLPTRDELEDIYGVAYFGAADGGFATREGYLDYVADAEVHRANARRRLRRVAAFTSPAHCSTWGARPASSSTRHARHGWQARGVDVSDVMVEWGRRHTSADIRVGTLDDMPPDRIESCITMWDYIEHALDPRGDVEQAFSRLRPGGVLALSTGDAGSALARLSLERWHLMTPRHHNYFFTGATIGAYWSRLGSRSSIWVIPRRSFRFGTSPTRRASCWTCPSCDALAGRLARSPFGARTVPVNLWDVMTVVGRRPAESGRR